MFIEINRIGPEGLAFDSPPRVTTLVGLGGEPVQVVSSRLTGDLARSDDGVRLRGSLQAVLEVPCSRCLAPVRLDASTDFLFDVVASDADTRGASEDRGEDDETILRAPGGRIDLDEVATEQLYLSLPLKPVCREDCRGLCPICRVNLNEGSCDCRVEDVDPRLAPLLEFKRRRSRD